MRVPERASAASLAPAIDELFALSAEKILALERRWNPDDGGPVHTAGGRYATRGWTEWTQGFQYGSALLQFEATGDERFLDIGRRGTYERLERQLTHTGVHDHGFQTMSGFGTLLRFADDGRVPVGEGERRYLELAVKTSGAVQAARWTAVQDGGFIHSFHGPHSLFIDTMRTLRVLARAHALGHVLLGERERRISLLHRLVDHATVTAGRLVYYGEGRDAYDVPGRTAQEGIFSVVDGSFRGPATQQGWSPYSTWMRGLAWGLLGFAEQLEFLDTRDGSEFPPGLRKVDVLARFERAARVQARYYLDHSAAGGIPYWDSAAPGLAARPEYFAEPADPIRGPEPVDSSAAAIAAQGLYRLGARLAARGESDGEHFRRASFAIARTIFADPYLARDPMHEGLILHSLYHRPAGWDRVPPGGAVASGESSMWGDFHARELALAIRREIRGEAPLRFFPPTDARRVDA